METPHWYVVTGGPSSGKTTLLNNLQKLGYHIIPEAARTLIDEGAAKGVSTHKLRKDEGLFQQQVLRRKLKIEEKTQKDEIVFFDRGTPDSIAYYKICGLDTKEIEMISRNRYRRVFFLEQVPFKEDYARTEDEATARRLSRLLLESYEDLGYEVVHIPAISIEERVKMILSRL